MQKQTFPENEVYLPVTGAQFESLVNEMVEALNVRFSPDFCNAEDVALTTISVIHHMDHKFGMIKKDQFFEECVNRISCNQTFLIAQGITAKREAEKAKAKAEAGEPTLSAVPDMPTEH